MHYEVVRLKAVFLQIDRATEKIEGHFYLFRKLFCLIQIFSSDK